MNDFFFVDFFFFFWGGGGGFVVDFLNIFINEGNGISTILFPFSFLHPAPRAKKKKKKKKEEKKRAQHRACFPVRLSELSKNKSARFIQFH